MNTNTKTDLIWSVSVDKNAFLFCVSLVSLVVVAPLVYTAIQKK
jgi:hypothetical protein